MLRGRKRVVICGVSCYEVSLCAAGREKKRVVLVHEKGVIKYEGGASGRPMAAVVPSWRVARRYVDLIL